MPSRPRIAIIGAGIAGLRMAGRLANAGDVVIFEKSRGFGGRMSTRRAVPYQFDHGAQYFTAHGAAFTDFIRPYLEAGTVQEWQPRLASLGRGGGPAPVWSSPRYVAVPGMTALCKSMADGQMVHRGVRTGRLERDEGGWTVNCEDGSTHRGFQWVISAAPSVQTKALMPQVAEGQFRWPDVTMQGCYSLMLGFKNHVVTEWDAAVVSDAPIAWIAMDHTKPGRSPQQASVLIQSGNGWAEEHMEADQEWVQQALCRTFEDLTGIRTSDAAYISLHRWRYAKVAQPAPVPFLLNGDQQLAAAGDWFGSGRVEAGFDSADALCSALEKQF